jgi:hypothetical protein
MHYFFKQKKISEVQMVEKAQSKTVYTVPVL